MVSIETPVEIKLSLGNPIYRGPEGKTPVKGVDYFTQEDINDIVAQIEGGEGIDLDGYATKEYVNEAVSGVVVSETDPTVPEWAKQATKPTYTANEVGALPADTVLFSGSYNDLTDKPTIPEVPANVSAFNNDAGYLTNVEFHDTINNTSVFVNDVGLYVETINNEQNPVYRTDVINMGVSANGPSGVVAISDGQLMFGEPTNGNMLTVSINENADSLYVNGDKKVALVSDIPDLTDYATKSYVETAIRGAESGLLKRSVVQALPTSDIDEDTIYMVAKTGSTGDVYDEYLYVNNNWEHIGSTDVDLTDYQKIIKIEVPNLVLSSNNPDILTEEQQNIIFDIYSKFINNEPIPDIYINGQRILFYNTNPAVTSATTLFRLYSLSYPLAKEKYQISKGISYEYFEVVINEDDTGLNSNRLYWGRTSQTAKDIKLTNNISIDGITRTYSNVEEALSALAYYYASKSYVDTAMPEYLTNTDILAIWNGENT